MEEIYSHVANLGFPIAVSVYLLVRIEGKLENLSMSIYELAKVIEGLK
ncbi:MAG: YvrJ family protein [Thermotaleaceae bacterium]